MVYETDVGQRIKGFLFLVFGMMVVAEDFVVVGIGGSSGGGGGGDITSRYFVASSPPSTSASVLSRKDGFWGFISFTIFGVASLVFWNALLNAIVMIKILCEAEHLSVIVTATFMTGTIFTNICCIYYGSLRSSILYVSGIILFVLSFAVPLVLQFTSGKIAEILILLLTIPIGMAAGTHEPASFAFAAVASENYSGAVSFGMGVSGVISFGLWVFYSMVVFSEETIQGKRNILWLFFSTLGLIYAVELITLWKLLRMSWMKEAVRVGRECKTREEEKTKKPLCIEEDGKGEMKRNAMINGKKDNQIEMGEIHFASFKENREERDDARDDARTTTTTTSPSCQREVKDEGEEEEMKIINVVRYSQEVQKIRDEIKKDENDEDEFFHGNGFYEVMLYYRKLLKKAWIPLFSVCVTLFISNMLYPNIGPLTWSTNTTHVTILIGMFQIGDFVGRYIPNVVKYFHKRFVSEKPPWYLFFCCVGRFLLVPIFILCSKIKNVFINEFWFQILLVLVLSVTNGWMATICLMTTPNYFLLAENKASSVSMAVFLMLIGTTAGLWMSRLCKI